MSSSSPPSSAETTVKTIKNLLREPFDIYDTRKLSNAGEREDAARLDELRRVFKKLVTDGELLSIHHDPYTAENDNENNTTVQEKWSCWIYKQQCKYVTQLCDRIRLGRRHALRTLCGLIASSPTSHTTNDTNQKTDDNNKDNAVVLDESLCQQLVQALCIRRHKQKADKNKKKYQHMPPPFEIDEPLLHLFETEFVRPYRDVQYYVLSSIHRLALKIPLAKEHQVKPAEESRIIADNILRLLMSVNIADTQEELKPTTLTTNTLTKGVDGTYLISSSSSSSQNAPSPAPTGSSPSLKHDVTNSDGSSSDDFDSDDDEETDSSDMEEEQASSSNNSKNNGRNKRKTVDPASTLIGTKRRRTSHPKSSIVTPFFLHSLSRHRRVFSDAWLTTLALLPSNSISHKRALQYLPEHVIPKMNNPLRLADYFTLMYDSNTNNNKNTVAPLLALQGLFHLMTRHGLEYPRFYQSLYGLLSDDNLFYRKHRTQCFRLLTVCLLRSHDMVPAYVVAAFCKRLCRCALTAAPPSGALFVVALVSNLLRRHGECACLVHRGGDGEAEDAFNAATDDPSQCRALESSLWELAALERHYHPAVAALAKVCGREDDKVPLHDMEEFLLHTYKSLFEQEQKRRVNKSGSSKGAAVPLTFREPKSLFVEGDVFFGKMLALPEPTRSNLV